jgi:hypothetical protein
MRQIGNIKRQLVQELDELGRFDEFVRRRR